MKRNAEIDIARMLGNYGIVAGHSGAAFQYCAMQGGEFLFWESACALFWALPSLFLISGYLMARGWSASTMKDKLFRRLKRLAVPYVAWNLLFVAFFLAMSGVVPRCAARVESLGLESFGGILSRTAGPITHPIDGPLWFMRTLVAFALAYPLLDRLVSKWKGLPALALVAGYFVCANTVGFMKPICGGTSYPPYGLAMFLLGAWCAKNGTDIVDTFSKPRWLALWSVYAACTLASRCLGLKFPAWLDGIIPIACFPVLFFLARVLAKRVAGSALFRRLSDMAFFAYCGHFLFCSIVLHTAAPLFAGMGAGKRTALSFVFMLGVPLMALVHSAGRRFAGRVFRIFDGTL